MARANGIIRWLTGSTNLDAEPLPGLPILELAGDKRVLVENHLGVSEYGRETIRVKVKFGQICIDGAELELKNMSRGQLVITGSIDAIRIVRG